MLRVSQNKISQHCLGWTIIELWASFRRGQLWVLKIYKMWLSGAIIPPLNIQMWTMEPSMDKELEKLLKMTIFSIKNLLLKSKREVARFLLPDNYLLLVQQRSPQPIIFAIGIRVLKMENLFRWEFTQTVQLMIYLLELYIRCLLDVKISIMKSWKILRLIPFPENKWLPV